MAWVVDTCLLIDVAEADPTFGAASARLLADILIGAFAMRFDGILTRNQADFRRAFPTLPITAP